MSYRFRIGQAFTVDDGVVILPLEATLVEACLQRGGSYLHVLKEPLAIVVCRNGLCHCLNLEGAQVEPGDYMQVIEGLSAWLESNGMAMQSEAGSVFQR